MMSVKQAAIILPVFAARTDHAQEQGIGDIGSLFHSLHHIKQLGFNVLQVLPVNDTGPSWSHTDPQNANSPYNAISAFAYDPIYVYANKNWVPGLPENAPSVPASYGEDIHYVDVRKRNDEIWQTAYKNWVPSNAFHAFCKENEHWLPAYAEFRARMELNKEADWRKWPQEQQQPTGQILQESQFYQYQQWVMSTQWKRLKRAANLSDIKLMGDMPFGISKTGCDAWATKDLVNTDWSIGVPPAHDYRPNDFVARWGQNWGIPPYKTDPQNLPIYKEWLSRRVKHLSNNFDILRLDYISGNFNSYAFPWDPKDNEKFTYADWEEIRKKCNDRVPQFLPGIQNEQDQLQVDATGLEITKTIKAAAGNMELVAENIGYVAHGVNGPNGALAKLDIAGCVLPIYERDEQRKFRAPAALSPNNVAYYGNHDNQPLHQYWQNLVQHWTGPDGNHGWQEMQFVLESMGWDPTIPPPTTFTLDVFKALMQRLYNSKCNTVAVPYNDLLGTKQINYPGVNTPDNWSGRMPATWTHLMKIPDIQQKLSAIKQLGQQRKQEFSWEI